MHRIKLSRVKARCGFPFCTYDSPYLVTVVFKAEPGHHYKYVEECPHSFWRGCVYSSEYEAWVDDISTGEVIWNSRTHTKSLNITPGFTKGQVENIIGDPVQTAETSLGLAVIYYDKRGDQITVLYDNLGRVSSMFRYNQLETLRNASHGDPKAHLQLGSSNLLGTKGRWRWLCPAAHLGQVMARYEIANYYRMGYAPVRQDPQQAMFWYKLTGDTKSADGSELPPVHMRFVTTYKNELAATMTAEDLSEIEHLVAEWQPNPAECEQTAVRADN